MKKLFVLFLPIALSSCGLGILDSPNPEGELAFYAIKDNGQGSISIEVDGQYFGTVTDVVSSVSPECGQPGLVTRTMAEGNHSFVATAVDGSLWRGQISVKEFECQTVLLN